MADIGHFGLQLVCIYHQPDQLEKESGFFRDTDHSRFRLHPSGSAPFVQPESGFIEPVLFGTLLFFIHKRIGFHFPFFVFFNPRSPGELEIDQGIPGAGQKAEEA